VRHDGRRVLAVETRDGDGREETVAGAHFLSSMPIRQLLNAFDPAPPAAALAAANRLRYRDFLTVALVVDRPDLFPDNWIYVHAPSVRVGRIQNFKNWSPEMVPDPSQSALGLEYFVQEGDDLWRASDEALIELARRECAQLGLVDARHVVDGAVVRVPKAYPVYDGGYRDALDAVRAYLDGFANLQLIGRNGQHRYNNQDHSMVTALHAVRNLADARYDVWDVNVEQDYHETVRAPAPGAGDRLAPGAAVRGVDEEMVRAAFARYDPLALGGALGVVAAAALFLATAIPLLRGADHVAPELSLLGQYLLGYRPSWSGAGLGLAGGGILGFLFGWVLARTINAVIGWHESFYRREVELARSLEALEEEAPS
jgi:hypothetical protein